MYTINYGNGIIIKAEDIRILYLELQLAVKKGLVFDKKEAEYAIDDVIKNDGNNLYFGIKGSFIFSEKKD